MKYLLNLLGATILSTTMIFAHTLEKTIVIDVGHGGHDTGFVYEDINEKDLALTIAQKVQEMNNDENLKIILTRDEDEFMTLKDRAEYINNLKPDIVISVHINGHQNEAKNGALIFFSEESNYSDQSKALASKLEIALQNIPYQTDIKNAKLSLLYNVNHPCVVLEVGYLSNEIDRAYLLSDEGQKQIAELILYSIN